MRDDHKRPRARPQPVDTATAQRAQEERCRRMPQKEPKRYSGGRKMRGSAVATLVVLMAVPVWAVSRSFARMDWRIVLEVVGTIWAVTYVMYQDDKRRAEAGKWRIPESVLHFWELAGGWPAAFVAQRALRHKIAKRSYQVTYWGIVSIHEFVAVDSLLSWRFTGQIAAAAQFVTPWLW